MRFIQSYINNTDTDISTDHAATLRNNWYHCGIVSSNCYTIHEYTSPIYTVSHSWLIVTVQNCNELFFELKLGL